MSSSAAGEWSSRKGGADSGQMIWVGSHPFFADAQKNDKPAPVALHIKRGRIFPFSGMFGCTMRSLTPGTSAM